MKAEFSEEEGLNPCNFKNNACCVGTERRSVLYRLGDGLLQPGVRDVGRLHRGGAGHRPGLRPAPGRAASCRAAAGSSSTLQRQLGTAGASLYQGKLLDS